MERQKQTLLALNQAIRSAYRDGDATLALQLSLERTKLLDNYPKPVRDEAIDRLIACQLPSDRWDMCN